ncbi:MAG: hypothetical protein DMF49_02865 [Acidobacteria bacterium]|nr:MAG: hypothetical protein DMF49_02865 [Acidobacteriota bacterium]
MASAISPRSPASICSPAITPAMTCSLRPRAAACAAAPPRCSCGNSAGSSASTTRGATTCWWARRLHERLLRRTLGPAAARPRGRTGPGRCSLHRRLFPCDRSDQPCAAAGGAAPAGKLSAGNDFRAGPGDRRPRDVRPQAVLMVILGVSCFYHDAAAALMIDGGFVAAAEEERFSRVKHDHGFPKEAIAYCLREAGISLCDVDILAFYEKPFLEFERILFTAIDTWPRSYKTFMKAMPSWLAQKQQFAKLVRRDLGFHGRIVFGEHHLSHAASSYLLSPFEEAAVLTVDGVGEWATTTIGRGEGSSLRLIKEIHFPHSLGLLYSTVTAHLGFRVNNDEYKVMGLAPYGSPRYADQMRRLLEIKPDGSFALDGRYFDYTRRMRMYGRRYLETFGPPRGADSELRPEHADLAASAQLVLEEALLGLAEAAHREVQTQNLCLAGGVALNCVANSKVPAHTPFRRMFIQPASGDSGGALGAAAFVHHLLLGRNDRRVMEHAYLCPSYEDWEIGNFLDPTDCQAFRRQAVTQAHGQPPARPAATAGAARVSATRGPRSARATPRAPWQRPCGLPPSSADRRAGTERRSLRRRRLARRSDRDRSQQRLPARRSG